MRVVSLENLKCIKQNVDHHFKHSRFTINIERSGKSIVL